jgi:hypothetical protein
VRENPHAEIIRRKGDEHGRHFWCSCSRRGREVVEVGIEEDGDLEEAPGLATSCQAR